MPHTATLKPLQTLLLVSLFVSQTFAQNVGEPILPLFEQALDHIAQDEYSIHKYSSSPIYHSPNRQNEFRASYDAQGFLLSDRSGVNDWQFGLTLSHIQQAQTRLLPSQAKEKLKEGNKLVLEYESFEVEYINSYKGMRQNVIVKQAPNCSEAHTLSVHFAIQGNMQVVQQQPTAILLEGGSEQTKQLWYKDLNIWDANGKPIRGHMEVHANELSLIAYVTEAEYPITIDPLSVSADWELEGEQIGAKLGFSVSGAGDVNRDGYSDVLIGAPLFDGGEFDEGKAYLFLGSHYGIESTPTWSIESNQAYAQLGYSLSNAGDVNADGYGDILIGLPYYDNGESDEGCVHLFYGSPDGLSTSPDWTVESNQSNAGLGHSVAMVGDLNGDSYSDIIVGIPFYDNTEYNEGAVFVFHGSVNGPPQIPNWTLESNQLDAEMGNAVAPAGDVNADGYSDVLIGAWKFNQGEMDEGCAQLFLGSPNGLGAQADWILAGNQMGAQLGNSLCSAGDLNGDGYSDLVIGASSFDGDEEDAGKVYVYYGSDAGIDSINHWTMTGDQIGAGFGSAVSIAGDVNGDGYSDIIIGASYYDHGETNEGKVYIYEGGKEGIHPTPLWDFESNSPNALLGMSVSSLGDVNGDGFSDVIMGAPDYNGGTMGEGKAFVFYGSANTIPTTPYWAGSGETTNSRFGDDVSSAGDLNGDGFSDIVVGASEYTNGEVSEGAVYVYYGSPTGFDSTYDWRFEADVAGATLGVSVSGAGDVNGDGYADLIVGASRYSNGQAFEGKAWVFHGSELGVSQTPNWSYESNRAFDALGTSVGSAGDVNGDGYMDVIIGSTNYSNEDSAEGIVHIFYGSSTGLSTYPNWSVEGNSPNSSFGETVSCAGDVNGDGYSDVIIGADSYVEGTADGGKVFLYHGSGAGPSATPDWEFALTGNFNAWLGAGANSAGDVNGDGYSDVIVSAPLFDQGGFIDAGKAWVFLGSLNGLSPNPIWEQTGSGPSAGFGSDVSGAGDVNGDGYGDVVVGSSFYSNSTPLGGAAYVYLGTAMGLSPQPYFTYLGDTFRGFIGWSVSGAGDVNGDGFSDFIIGARDYSMSTTMGGATFLFCGNAGKGMLNYAAQYATQSSDLIPVGAAVEEGGVDLALYQKGYEGRQKGKLVWEVTSNAIAFGGNNPLTNSTQFSGSQSSYTDLGLTGTVLRETLPSFDSGEAQKWRTRTAFSQITSITGQVYGPWRYYFNLEPNAPATSFLKESNAFPVELLYFDGWQDNQEVTLEWTTAQELNNKGFYIQHADVSNRQIGDFENLGFVPGIGTTDSPEDYTYIVNDLAPGIHIFRLMQVDLNGDYTYSHQIEVEIIMSDAYLVFPNPLTASSHINLSVAESQYVKVQLVGMDGSIHPLYQGQLNAGFVECIRMQSKITSGMYIIRIDGEYFFEEFYKVIVVE